MHMSPSIFFVDLSTPFCFSVGTALPVNFVLVLELTLETAVLVIPTAGFFVGDVAVLAVVTVVVVLTALFAL